MEFYAPKKSGKGQLWMKLPREKQHEIWHEYNKLLKEQKEAYDF